MKTVTTLHFEQNFSVHFCHLVEYVRDRCRNSQQFRSVYSACTERALDTILI